jgi:hypothetical protein
VKTATGQVEHFRLPIFCNGEALLKNFNIYREAGGQDRALMRQFKGLQPDAQGKLLLEFKPVVNYALINAIEVIDEASPKSEPPTKSLAAP